MSVYQDLQPGAGAMPSIMSPASCPASTASAEKHRAAGRKAVRVATPGGGAVRPLAHTLALRD